METQVKQDGKGPREGPETANKDTPRAVQLREYTLKEFWEIFVDDRPFGADALVRHVNVQSKAVFSHAMAVMDKIRGWEEEERWDPSLPRACGSSPNKL